MSSKTSATQKLLAAEEFTYPPFPSGEALGAGDVAQAGLRGTARGNPAPLANTESEAETAAKREQQAWSKGVEAGTAELRAEFEHRSAKMREEIARGLRDFAVERETYFHRVEEQVVRLTLAIARKILNREAQVDPLLLTGVLRVAMEKVGANTSTRLRANPSDIKVWREYFAQSAENFPAPELIGDPDLEPSRCILETEIGTTEIGLETQLKEIEHGFLDLLAQRPGTR